MTHEIDTNATCTFQVGQSEFEFRVFESPYHHASKYHVKVTQIVDMSELGLDDAVIKWKIACTHCTTEHSAIHYAGKKLIKNWYRFARIGKDHPVKDPLK